MSCQRLISAFEDCSRKHPVEAKYLCRHLEAAVAWCLVASVCPDEGAHHLPLLVFSALVCRKTMCACCVKSKCFLNGEFEDLSVCAYSAVEDVEACVGRTKRLGPPTIPRKCFKAAARLDDCLEQHSAQLAGGIGDT